MAEISKITLMKAVSFIALNYIISIHNVHSKFYPYKFITSPCMFRHRHGQVHKFTYVPVIKSKIKYLKKLIFFDILLIQCH